MNPDQQPNPSQNPVPPTPAPAPTPPPAAGAPVPYPASPGANQMASGSSSSGLSIAGLVLAILLPLIGLIISLIAKSQAKKAGRKDTIATIGVIIGGILTAITIAGFVAGFVMASHSGIKDTAKDVERTTDVNFLGTSIQTYVTDNGKFPESLDDLSSVANFDSAALKTPEGGTYDYKVTPYGCDKASTCTGYVVSTTGSDGNIIQKSNTIDK